MEDELKQSLRVLVRRGAIAALGTLHQGEPAISMVPYVLFGDSCSFLIHVSTLSGHTLDMLEHPRVSLMVAASEQTLDENGEPTAPQALPRVIANGAAKQIPRPGEEYATGRAAYLRRFPQTGQIFELADFSLFLVTVQSARYIAGFGKARSLDADSWRQIFRERGAQQ